MKDASLNGLASALGAASLLSGGAFLHPLGSHASRGYTHRKSSLKAAKRAKRKAKNQAQKRARAVNRKRSKRG